MAVAVSARGVRSRKYRIAGEKAELLAGAQSTGAHIGIACQQHADPKEEQQTNYNLGSETRQNVLAERG